MPTFRTRSSISSTAESPERLFDDLARESGGPEALWSHQADILRSYHGEHLATPDIALELPTGAGKTLPGLLVLEWRRRRFDQRVIYACPTVQLVKQVGDAARGIGIQAVSLVGSHHDWSTSEKLSYEAGKALAVTTYSTVFNVHPALEPAQTILFDDAHAAESFVAGAWSVPVNRFDAPTLYAEVLECLRPALSGITYQMLEEGDGSTHRTVHLVGVSHTRRLAPRLMEIFRSLGKNNDLYWRGEALSGGLERCQIYVAWDSILIRPFIPPAGSHRHFTEPKQRIYLSATLGEAGELERAFGRSPIKRLAIPEGWDTRGAGRRFFVFPDLQSALPPRELAASIVATAGKALVLTPSIRKAEAAADLVPSGGNVLGPQGAVDQLLSAFRGEKRGILTLANRYDGIDLPNTACQVTVLDGNPSGAHLQERFLSDTLVAGRVLRERLRTRFMQGAGRCTRGLSDHSVVIVLGDDVTRFVALPEVHNALSPELQAELDFGLQNSEVTPEEILDFVRSFLAQDRDWLEQAEPELLDARKSARRSSPAENIELAASAVHEVKAAGALWSGDWAAASRSALDAANAIRSQSLGGYRALWTYLAGAWLAEEANDRDDDGLRQSSLDLLRKAHAASRSAFWLRDAHPLPPGEIFLDELDLAAVRSANRNGPRGLASAKWATLHTDLLAGLSQQESRRYEAALVELGKLLGAEAYKPPGEARTDSAWVWQGYWWLAIEAKTEERDDAPLSVATVRQANDHLKTIAFDRNEAVPDDSAVLILSPRQLVNPTAAVVAEPFLHLASPDLVLDLAKDAVRAWKSIRAQGSGMSEDQTVALISRVLSEHRVLPTDVRTRLVRDPIQG